jgi:hypothetical protein
MTKRLCIIAATLAWILSGCARVQVSQDYATDYPFGRSAGFNWNVSAQKENSGLQQQDELLASRFKRAVETVLTSRGYQLADSPELLVSYLYTVSKMLESEPVASGFGYGYERYGRYGTIGINNGTYIRQYQQGMLVIQIHSAETGQLIWKGIGTREVHTHSNPDDITIMVYEMVEAVLSQFPPDP